MYQAGLVSISFRKNTPEEIIAAVKAAGLSCIEWGSDVHAPCNDEARLHQIVAAQQAAGISCCSYGTYFKFGQHNVSELYDYIKAAKILGTRIIRLWCGAKGSAQYTPEEKEALFAECRAAAKIGEENDVIFCMECHNWTFTDTKESTLELMQAVDSPAFRMYYQPNQLRTFDENMAYAKLLAPYTEHVHVFNWDAPDGLHAMRYPLAGAISTWKDYLKQLPGDRALLLEFMPDDRIESLSAEAAALREIIGG